MITSGSTTSTILESSSIVVFETTATVEFTATTATSEDMTATTATSDDITTTIAAAEDTTTLTETSAATTSDAATTSEAPAGEPTYVLSATGGSLNGAQAYGIGQQGSWISFNPAIISGSTVRRFIIDSIGRLQDAETQAYVCANYYDSPNAASPPYVTFCMGGPVGGVQGQEYLTCEINSGNLACTAPRVFCSTNANDETTCPRQGGDPHDTFFTGSQDLWRIGSGNPPNTSPIIVSIRRQR